MKPFRIVLAALSVVFVTGAVVQAARQTPASNARPVTSLFASSPHGPGGSADAKDEPAGSDEDGSGRASTATPDFSACVGLTGLDNAICHVQANATAHPNPGLTNALTHLKANQAAQAARAASSPVHGNSAAGLAHAPSGIPGS